MLMNIVISFVGVGGQGVLEQSERGRKEVQNRVVRQVMIMREGRKKRMERD